MSSETVYVIKGKVHYKERIGLLPDSTLSVFLQDISLKDVSSVELARDVTPNAAVAGLNFELMVASPRIIPGHSYAISARIETAGKLTYVSKEHNPIVFDDNISQPLDILVSAV